MRTLRLLSFLLCLFAWMGAAFAADCMNGQGELHRPLWDGYTLNIEPAQGAHVNECRAAVVAADGKAIFETFAVDAEMLRITGKDVNAEGKPDVVLLTHAASSPENVYSIIATDPPGLVRQIATSAELSFQDRSDGKVDIVTHETSFADMEGLSADQLAPPMIVLRMRGKEIYNVSQVFWPDYEREIAIAKAKLSKNDIAEFSGNLRNQQKENEKEPSPQEIAHTQDIRGVVLQIVLDNLYGGRGQEAWQALKEMWPYADRDRVRQEILRRRMSGVMRDISRPAAKQASAQ